MAPQRVPHPRPDRARPSDEEVAAIARRVLRAMAGPAPDDPRDDILSRAHELPLEDEARVIAAAVALRRGR